MSDEISACPFCKSVRTRVISVRDGVRVHCGDCLAEGPPIFLGPEGREAARKAAIAAWGPISPCPHIATSREGTSYCRLAESGATEDRIVASIQSAMNSIMPPKGMTEYRAEYWKAGVRAAIRAVNAALTQPEKSP